MTSRRFVPPAITAEVVLAVLASCATTLLYQGFFATNGYLPVLALAAGTGGVTAALGHRRTWSVLVLAAVGLALVLVFAVFRGETSAVLPGLRGSWSRLLTAAPPADTWGELLVVPVFVTWAASFFAVLLVLLTRNAPAPLLPPLAAFVFGLVAVGKQGGDHPTATVVFLLTALALIGLRTHRNTGTDPARGGLRPARPVIALGGVSVMIAVSALFGVAGGQTLPLASGDHRFDPRDVLTPPLRSTDTLSPLSQLKSQLLETPARALFTVKIESGRGELVDRVRTAALDSFDGTTWTSSDTYRMAGAHLPTDPALSQGTPIRARIDVAELTGPYLPVIGWPSELSVLGVEERIGFDPVSGVAARVAAGSPRISYDVAGEVVARDPALLSVPTASTSATALPPGMPAELRKWADHDYEDNGSALPFHRLAGLEAHLRTYLYKLDRPPGHSYATLAQVMNEPGGYAEQYAAAFAVIARTWNMPVRLAVGYLLRNKSNGVYQVTTADAHVWPEVHFADYGWVDFDPTRIQDVPAVPAAAPVPQVVPPRPAPPTEVPAASPPDASSTPGTADDRGVGWNALPRDYTLLISASLVAVVVLIGGVVVAKVVRRRHRRHRSGHAAQVLGAWREQVDRLVERGISVPVSLTFREVAEHAGSRLGEAASTIAESAELATTAVYAPDVLDAGDAGDAERAWLLATLLRTRPRRAARLRAAVDPRPLWTTWSLARQRRLAREVLEVGRYR